MFQIDFDYKTNNNEKKKLRTGKVNVEEKKLGSATDSISIIHEFQAKSAVELTARSYVKMLCVFLSQLLFRSSRFAHSLFVCSRARSVYICVYCDI